MSAQQLRNSVGGTGPGVNDADNFVNPLQSLAARPVAPTFEDEGAARAAQASDAAGSRATPLAPMKNVFGRASAAAGNHTVRDPRLLAVGHTADTRLVIPESMVEQASAHRVEGQDIAKAGETRDPKLLWRILRERLMIVIRQMSQQVVDIGGGRGVEGVSCPRNGDHHIGKIYLSEENKAGWLNHARKAEEICDERRLFFHPNSTTIELWDLGQVLLLFYVAVAVPVQTGLASQFKVEPFSAWFFFELAVDMLFICDIFVNFRTAYYDTQSGNLEVDLTKITMRYVKTWFFVDVFSCLPITYINLITDPNREEINQDGTKMLKGLRLLRLAKMLRLAKLKAIIERQDKAVGPLMQSFKLVGVMGLLVFTAHLIACLWYFVGEIDEYVMMPSRGTYTDADSGNVEECTACSSCSKCTECCEMVEEGWVHIMENEWESQVQTLISVGNAGNATYGKIVMDLRGGYWPRYVRAMYWAMTSLSTVGYGDIHARTTIEMIFSVLVEMVGGISFATLVGSLSTLMLSTGAAGQLYHKSMDEVREFLRAKDISEDVRHAVVAYYTHYYRERTVFNANDIISKLPQKLQTHLVVQIYGDIIQGIPIFQDLDDRVLAEICFKLRPMRVPEDTDIVQQGENGYEMYLLLNGECEVFRDGQRLGYLHAGSYFGELAVLVDTGLKHRVVTRARTVRSTAPADLCFLTKSDLHEVAMEHTSVADILQKFEATRVSTAILNGDAVDGAADRIDSGTAAANRGWRQNASAADDLAGPRLTATDGAINLRGMTTKRLDTVGERGSARGELQRIENPRRYNTVMNGRMDDIGGALSVSMIARQLHALELAQADDNAVMEAIMKSAVLRQKRMSMLSSKLQQLLANGAELPT